MRNAKSIALILIVILALNGGAQTFDKVKIVIPNGTEVDEHSVTVAFLEDSLRIEGVRGSVSKTFKYSEIRAAEYSYTKNPRWKTGVGLGAASVLFPPLILIALPIGFTKHRRHWLTIRTESDFAVLKLSKKNRKLILPTFETRTGIRISGEGEDK